MDKDIVEKIAAKTRTGYIPNAQKVNQDSHLIIKDFGGINKLWMLGVMDGHGTYGHNAS